MSKARDELEKVKAECAAEQKQIDGDHTALALEKSQFETYRTQNTRKIEEEKSRLAAERSEFESLKAEAKNAIAADQVCNTHCIRDHQPSIIYCVLDDCERIGEGIDYNAI